MQIGKYVEFAYPPYLESLILQLNLESAKTERVFNPCRGV